MLPANDLISYRGRALVPEPRCVECSYGIPLDTKTYFNFHGPVRCPTCLFLNFIAFSNGEVLQQGAVVEPKFFIAEAHSIPSQPLGDYEEAVSCLRATAWKAAAVMARRALQGALLECGVQDARPRQMIDAARQKDGLLNEAQHQLATTVTFFGGEGAHPENASHPANEEINLVGRVEAENGVWVTKTLLLALFPSND